MEFYGVVGEKLPHSLSPKIHNRVFQLLNMECAYKLFEIEKDKIGELGNSLKLLNIKGVNVTIPYKKEVMKELDFISEEAKKIGAVNTIYLKDNKLYGYNTDYFGFGKMLENKNITSKDKTAANLEALSSLLKYEIISVDNAQNLVDKGKIDFEGAQAIINIYSK